MGSNPHKPRVALPFCRLPVFTKRDSVWFLNVCRSLEANLHILPPYGAAVKTAARCRLIEVSTITTHLCGK